MMTFVQLGWIQDAINYVFDKLLTPIFSWVSEFLSGAFDWLFNSVLGSLLQSFIKACVDIAAKLIMILLGRFFYRIEVYFLMLVDMMQSIFNVLAGTQAVTDKNTGITGSLLYVIARKEFVLTTMMLIMAVSVILCVSFSIVATIKSIGDMGGAGSRPVGQVLRKTAQAMLRMIIAPALGLFLILLGDAVMSSITKAMTIEDNVTIARSIFVISTLDAVDELLGAEDKDGNMVEDSSLLAYNYSTRPEYLADHPGAGADYGLTDKFREPFYTGKKDYSKLEYVDKTFDYTRINYLVGIAASILFVLILGTAMFVLVSRIFDVLVLLIIEPFFIATMPIDDGEHFQKWEDMFIAKLFSGYGMIITMYLYLLISSLVFGGTFSFTPREGMGDIMMDMLMKIILLVGGAATVMTAGPLVTSLLNSAAAGQEAEASAAGMAFTSTAMELASRPARYLGGKAIDAATDAVLDKIFDGFTEKSYDNSSQPQPNNNTGNKFNGTKKDKK